MREATAGTTPVLKNTRTRLAVEISSSAALAAFVSPGQRGQNTANTYGFASVPPVAGDDPVNESDPSGKFLCSPTDPWTYAGCAGDAVEGIGEEVAGGAAVSLDVPIAIGTVLGTGIAVAWSGLQAKPAGGNNEVPIYFGQRRIGPRFSDGTDIRSTPNGSPIDVFPCEVGGAPIAVAINNRTLANYSLNSVYYPPVKWEAPSGAEIGRLKEQPIPPETSLPSLVTVVTSNQCSTQPLTDYGVGGVVPSLSFAKFAY